MTWFLQSYLRFLIFENITLVIGSYQIFLNFLFFFFLFLKKKYITKFIFLELGLRNCRVRSGFLGCIAQCLAYSIMYIILFKRKKIIINVKGLIAWRSRAQYHARLVPKLHESTVIDSWTHFDILAELASCRPTQGLQAIIVETP